MSNVFSYKIVVDNPDLLKLEAVGPKAIGGIIIIAIALISLAIGLGLSFSSTRTQSTGGKAISCVALLILLVGIRVTISSFVHKKQIIVDRTNQLFTIEKRNINFSEIDRIALHTEWHTQTTGSGVETLQHYVRAWRAVIVLHKQIPMEQKVPSFMIKQEVKGYPVKDTIELFQVTRVANYKKDIDLDVTERSAIPQFYDFIDKIHQVSGIKIDNQIGEDFKKDLPLLEKSG